MDLSLEHQVLKEIVEKSCKACRQTEVSCCRHQTRAEQAAGVSLIEDITQRVIVCV